MKICFLIEEIELNGLAAPNGAMVQIYTLAKGFVNAGWEVYICAGTKIYKSTNIKNGIKICYWKRTKYFSIINLFNAYSTISKIKADVYYQRGRSFLTFINMLSARVTHGLSLWSSNGHEGCRKWHQTKKILRKHKNPIKKILILPLTICEDFLIHFAIRRSHILLCQTKSQQSDLQRYHQRIGKIIKSGHFRLNEIPPKAYPPIILFLSHLIPIKRPELFIEIAKKFRNQNCRFALAGNLHTSNKEEILASIAQEKNIDYLGALPFEQSVNLVARAFLLINTAKLEGEGLSNSMVLAWLHGTPVLSLESDPDDIIMLNQLGIRCDTIINIEKFILQLLSDLKLWQRYSDNSYRYASEHFLIEVIINNLIRIIEKY